MGGGGFTNATQTVLSLRISALCDITKGPDPEMDKSDLNGKKGAVKGGLHSRKVIGR